MKSVAIPLLLSNKLYPTYHILLYQDIQRRCWPVADPSSAALIVSVRVSSWFQFGLRGLCWVRLSISVISVELSPCLACPGFRSGYLGWVIEFFPSQVAPGLFDTKALIPNSVWRRSHAIVPIFTKGWQRWNDNRHRGLLSRKGVEGLRPWALYTIYSRQSPFGSAARMPSGMTCSHAWHSPLEG
jgi:hypothetical protein